MKRPTTALLLAVSTNRAASLIPEAVYTFGDYIRDFERDYKVGSKEYAQRQAIFEASLAEVLAHNSNSRKTWTLGVNQFSDLSKAELASTAGRDKALARQFASLRSSDEPSTVETLDDLPATVDWREKGVITEVKNQKSCGSCWAFGTTETVESYAAINSGKLKVLAPQQLVECAPNPLQCGGVGGCAGSIPEVAYGYVQQFGMTTEDMMPYKAQNANCSFDLTKTPSAVVISGYNKLPENNYNAVMRHLATVGPLAINVDASTWHNYEGGIYNGCDLNKVDVDHVVQLVGYGTDPKMGDYFSVRNSWGTTWGEKGYIRLKREAGAKCGEDRTPLDGTGCKGGPPTQKVCGSCGVIFDTSYPIGAGVLANATSSVVV